MDKYSDQDLMMYINKIFDRYDHNRDACLQINEFGTFFNELFLAMSLPMKVDSPEMQKVMDDVDINKDGKASKEEVFRLFKALLFRK